MSANIFSSIFHAKTITAPPIIPAIAPYLFILFQNTDVITTGPNEAPSPAHAFETSPKTELSGSNAIITPITAMAITDKRPTRSFFLSSAFLSIY